MAEELFERLEASPAETTWKVECSLAEIYNERVRSRRPSAASAADAPRARRCGTC